MRARVIGRLRALHSQRCPDPTSKLIMKNIYSADNFSRSNIYGRAKCRSCIYYVDPRHPLRFQGARRRGKWDSAVCDHRLRMRAGLEGAGGSSTLVVAFCV